MRKRSPHDIFNAEDTAEESNMVDPHIPTGVSGTALAASLIRDGWSLAKIYAKYQEAVDALRHEQLGRKQSQAILEWFTAGQCDCWTSPSECVKKCRSRTKIEVEGVGVEVDTLRNHLYQCRKS